jgi:hypothetical protein
MLALPGRPLAADELSGRRHRVQGIGGDDLAVQVDLAEHPGGQRTPAGSRSSAARRQAAARPSRLWGALASHVVARPVIWGGLAAVALLALVPGQLVKGMGGAMDLVAAEGAARQVAARNAVTEAARLRKCSDSETDLGDTAVRQPRTRRSQKINMSGGMRSYTCCVTSCCKGLTLCGRFLAVIGGPHWAS